MTPRILGGNFRLIWYGKKRGESTTTTTAVPPGGGGDQAELKRRRAHRVSETRVGVGVNAARKHKGRVSGVADARP
jgi:hypothetical protein